jgi:hypothetical protein
LISTTPKPRLSEKIRYFCAPIAPPATKHRLPDPSRSRPCPLVCCFRRPPRQCDLCFRCWNQNVKPATTRWRVRACHQMIQVLHDPRAQVLRRQCREEKEESRAVCVWRAYSLMISSQPSLRAASPHNVIVKCGQH